MQKEQLAQVGQQMLADHPPTHPRAAMWTALGTLLMVAAMRGPSDPLWAFAEDIAEGYVAAANADAAHVAATDPQPGRRKVLTLYPHDQIEAGLHNGHPSLRIYDDGPDECVLVFPDDDTTRRDLADRLSGVLDYLARSMTQPAADDETGR